MDVEHGRNGHIDVATMEALVLRGTCQSPKHHKGVQHELPMAKIDPLRIAGGTGSIEGRGASVFVKVGKIEVLCTPRQQVFILCCKGDKSVRLLSSSASIAVLTAVSKPTVTSVPYRLWSMVLGTPTTAQPRAG